MLCEKCKQKEASVHYTEVVNGEVTEHNFCLDCAKELDVGGSIAALFEGGSHLGRLLSGLFGFDEEAADDGEEETGIKIACPTCHTSYEEFVRESKFGCPDCYEVFDLLIEDQIKAIQGNHSHVGKSPQTASVREEEKAVEDPLKILQSHLQEALREEEYEKAAYYRDEIKKLKEEGVSADD
ncbi:Nucleotide excision repair protein [Lachnospiraceae bacterium TWA4]|nr:Nucleotide excision repair protein [Lachnospiraceae bacterium TWA4]